MRSKCSLIGLFDLITHKILHIMAKNKHIPKMRNHTAVWLLVWLSTVTSVLAQTGNYVHTGGEAVNYGTINLATPSGITWATNRSATPGYFSAFGAATYTGASDAANVNGYVKHYVQAANQGFTFPVGSGADLRTLTTSGTITSGVTYATAWITGNPGTTTDPTDGSTHNPAALGTGLTGVSTVGQWDWVVTAGSAVGATITVSIPDLSSLGTAAQLRLVGWNGSQWVNLSGTTGASGNTENSTVSGTLISGITALNVGLVAPNPAGTIDCAQTMIQPTPIQGTAGQFVIKTSIDVTTPGSYSLAVSGSGMTLANGVTSVITSQTGVQTFYIPVNYDGTSALGSTTLTVGSTGSCVLTAPLAAATIDCSQTALSPAPVQGAAGQTVLIATVNVTTAGMLPVMVSGSGMTLANGQSSVSTTTTGVQKIYLLLNYSGATLGTLNFTIGNSSCSANLTTPAKQTVANVWTLACVPTLGPVLK